MATEKSCVVVLDGHGDLHAAVMREFQTARNAAHELVKNTIPWDPQEWFQYGVVENCDDPGKARLLGRGKTAQGQFRMGTS